MEVCPEWYRKGDQSVTILAAGALRRDCRARLHEHLRGNV
jgi:hypothetical protein